MNHSHILYDSDPHFRIDPITRRIVNESSSKTTLIQHDHNSERFTFEIPRYVEGHDMSLCNVVEIHYLNIEGNTKTVKAGVYTVSDLQIKADDENSVVCSWLVPNNATQFVGQLQFLIRFSCVYEDTGTVDYVWNTAVYSGITVSSGIYNSDSPSDNPRPYFNFVTTINGLVLKFFVGTREEYNALSYEEKQGLYAIITNDTTREEIENAIEELQRKYDEIIDGDDDGDDDGDTVKGVESAKYLLYDDVKFGRRKVFDTYTNIQGGFTNVPIPYNPTIDLGESVFDKFLVFAVGGGLDSNGTMGMRTAPIKFDRWVSGPKTVLTASVPLLNGAFLVVKADHNDEQKLSFSISGSDDTYSISAIYEEF